MVRLERDGRRDGGPIVRDTALLQLALGLTPPWSVSRADFDAQARRLDIQIDFALGGLVVTSVPKVPFWKSSDFNKLRPT